MEHGQTVKNAIGFGYSQSARFLRNFVYEGFNADEQGKKVFDGLFIASAGAGRGDFNHRFSTPGVAGNSVLSILRPVDMFPFADLAYKDKETGERDGLLLKAEAMNVIPKIFYTYTSTEYWARYGSLTHTSVDGKRDLPLHPQTRLYFIAGTPHAGGPFPWRKSFGGTNYEYALNLIQQKWVLRSLLLSLEGWINDETPPPPSAYPTIRMKQLVPLHQLGFPKNALIDVPSYMPCNWRMNFGEHFDQTGIAAYSRPILGKKYTVLLPKVNEDGNEISGIQLPLVAVPLATVTGWNYELPRLENLNYLGGLCGSFIPFARNEEERKATRDTRLSVIERYKTLENYLELVNASAESLAKQGYIRKEDIGKIAEQGKKLWDYLMNEPTSPSNSNQKK